MGQQNFIVPWILYVTLLCELISAGSEKPKHIPEHNLDFTSRTTVRNVTNDTLVVQTHLRNTQDTNLMWTDCLTDGQFGHFRFGIGLGPVLGTSMNEVTSPLLHIGGSERLSVTVTAETNRSDVRLVIIECKLVSKMNKTKSYFIQDGCLDHRMVKNISREDNKMVFTLHLSGVALSSGSSMVFISCEVKLCLISNHPKSCSSFCPLQLLSKQPPEPVLETRTYHIITPPIYVIKEERKKASTNYAAMVIGMVLGGTVLAVVVLLVRKSFSGVRRRNILMDL
ncbi:uncharacterized protein ACNLHF_007359 [Anomaloglossus baeobatrachus]|uniref:uncharacterized protein LOC142255337 n=1 Tax=Anomaloglossus baeobatrachus TaxID=238106 RepID=UPI003F50239E